MNKDDLNEVTRGCEPATRFLLSFLAFVHLIDDIHDKDKELTDVKLINVTLWWMEEFVANPWVEANRQALWPLIVAGCNAWLDSNQWERDGKSEKRAASEVMKSSYQEVVFYTAYLCGGLSHMNAMSRKHREYNFEHKG